MWWVMRKILCVKFSFELRDMVDVRLCDDATEGESGEKKRSYKRNLECLLASRHV